MGDGGRPCFYSWDDVTVRDSERGGGGGAATKSITFSQTRAIFTISLALVIAIACGPGETNAWLSDDGDDWSPPPPSPIAPDSGSRTRTPQETAGNTFLGISITIFFSIIACGCYAGGENNMNVVLIVVAFQMFDIMSDWAFYAIDLRYGNGAIVDTLRAPALAFCILGTIASIIGILGMIGSGDPQGIAGGAVMLFIFEDLPQFIILLVFLGRSPDPENLDNDYEPSGSDMIAALSFVFTCINVFIGFVKTCSFCCCGHS